MKKIAIIIFILLHIVLYGQKQDTIKLTEITIVSDKTPLKIKNVPASISIINSTFLQKNIKTIGADEALRLVPGLMIDNQHNSEKMHIYIRGQGILTENGIIRKNILQTITKT